MAPPPKVIADQGSASARSGSTSNNNNNSVGGATGAVPKQQTPLNGAPASGANASPSTVTSRSARSRRQQEHLGEPDLDFAEPLQRETLKTLNDLLQRARISNGKNRSPADQQLSSKETKSTAQQQQQRETLRQLAAEQSSYESAEQLQEQQQRYRFPVRPVQRVQHQPSSSSNSSGAPSSSSALLRLRQSTPPNATVGVVIPNATTSNGNGHISGPEEQSTQLTPAGLHQLIQRLFGVNPLAPRHETGRSQVDVLRTLLGLDENLNSNRQQPGVNLVELNNMVHEINPNAEQEEGIVNSTSLEDVALSEMSDNRAQSIQSLHSVLETPTPDTTPSFDELQQRLEASNRNMQHLQDEQAKLLHIQNMAKSHLSEMEQLRQQADRLPHNSNGGEAPKYESVQQVQNDMASLVGRMKNLTAFIHNQNELSTVLGDDGPEILAEQQALQEKLESLRTQREDMRNLVDELNSINRTARESTRAVKEETPTPSPKPAPAPVAVKERVVPVEYQRNVPIMRQEAANAAQRALQAQAMINQKTADIEALKAQMARLKGMLNTVSQIEESTPSMGASLERRSEESSSVERELPEEISKRVFELNDFTSELRAEAASLQKERDRILALKAEIERRKQQAASAVQLGDDALKRSSLTPTPTPLRQHQEEEEEEEEPSEVDTSLQATPTKEQLRNELRLQCERLRKEYEQKQRELEQRYVASNNTTSEADDEGNDDTDSDKYFANVRTASSATLKRAASASTVVEQRRGQQPNIPQQQAPPPPAPPSTLNEDDLNATLDTLSLGNDSLPSSSNRSQYMPPPMAPVPGIWASHNPGNAWHGQQPIYGPAGSSTGTEFKPPPTAAQVGSSNASGSNTSSDAVLLQQFMQTQQMLINSVCQCNQTLWHQQREIDNLNNQLHTLQDRFNVVACQDHSFGLRSESVPPPNLPVGPGMGQMPNNLCLGNSRAQSEQLFNFGAHQSAFSNYQRSCHRTGSESHHHQQQQHQTQPFLNNAAPPPPPTHYNNETPLSPPTYRSSPGPIFMNHHNNTIHQNNSNLRTQNQHANNLHSLPEGAAGGGAPGAGITLNNQVPPGNRANNYWDNFRSHSRQNLLSNKSNEELNMDHQQYRRQRAPRPSYFAPPQLMAPPTTRGGLTHQQQQRRHFFETPLTALHGSSANGSNNLNNSGSAGRKRDWREDPAHNRDHDDEDVDEVEENHDNAIFGSGRRRNRRRPQLSTLRDEEPEQASSSNLNMNVNYGNSPLYQRNKVPAKPTTSTVSLTPLQQRHLRFNFELPAHYMDYIDLPQMTPVDTTPILGQEPSPMDESNAMEQTEETASEELNRNLLVNALKNDKFTTKFYESIKEDVYRRLETLFEQQQQQQQQNQQMQQSQEPHGLRKALNQEETEPTGDVEATESRSETPLEVMRLQLDNDRPEDDKGSPVKQLTVVIPQNGAVLEDTAASASGVTSSVRSEIEEQMLEGKAEHASGSASGAGTSMELAPDHELIEYIIKRIRNQTHNNTVINDSLLAEVSKLTATAAQNSAASSPLISPKRIYAKIKKMDMPRQRDEFLLWYRSYLEQLFVVEQPQDSCKAKPKAPTTAAGSPAKQTNKRVREQSQSQSQDSNNDADLAEADQKNTSSSGNGDLECENNENPGEEADGQAAAESSGAEKQESSLE
ncbi:putative uncharacterized protein DDB_G0271606 isoform X1 [Drosophila subpulchrella]|uniref:putative uncharacterized protein DDB_G0271606 isoform X1 n=1 Tax=Drosophila subpulchrella TaxID=1486046 RepID=UPI0018A16144|nr:putative uncharacterized protein DDB_G0271606 isoform X1 [Drosophila subpulchrella]